MKNIFLISSLLVSLSGYHISNLSIDESREKTPISAIVRKRLHSSNNEKQFYCYEYSPVGYCIVDFDTGSKIEFSYESVSPYLNSRSSDELIYDGPMNYDIRQLQTNGIKKKKAVDYIKINETPLLSSTTITDWLIDDYELLAGLSNFDRENGRNGEQYNKDGTCGYLAAAMILYYSKYKYNNAFISDSYIETVNSKRRFKASFHDYLVEVGKSLKKNYSTTAFDIKAVMEEYCSMINVSANHFSMLLSTYLNIRACIADNKPIALFGNFRRPDNGKKINHAVTCYGIKTEVLGGGATQDYFIVNFGWTGYSRIYLLDNILLNPVGSMYNMNY